MKIELKAVEEICVVGLGVSGSVYITNAGDGKLRVGGFNAGLLEQLAEYPLPRPAPDFKAIANELFDMLFDAQRLLSKMSGELDYFERTNLGGEAALLLERVECEVKDK